MFVAAIVAPFHARGEIYPCAKDQHKTQGTLAIHWGTELMGLLQRQQHQVQAHSPHLLYKSQTNFSPSFSSSNQVVIFLLGNYRITKKYRQNYTRQNCQL